MRIVFSFFLLSRLLDVFLSFLFCSFSVIVAMSAPWCCLFFAKIQQIGGYILQIYKYYVIFAWILNKMLVSASAAPWQKGV